MIKTTCKALFVAITLLSVMGSSQLQAGDFGKFLGRELKRNVERKIRKNHHQEPRCDDPRRCPQPEPYPVPRPACHYFLGVWTTLVQLAPPVEPVEQPLFHAAAAPSTRVAPGYGQPTYGLRVDRTVEHSPACRGGLEPNDVLLTANGRSLHCKQDLLSAIRTSHGHLQLLVLDGRTGQVVTMNIRLEAR